MVSKCLFIEFVGECAFARLVFAESLPYMLDP